MGHLAFLGSTIGILVLFFLLVEFESRRGFRLFAARRAALDTFIDRAVFIWTHVDLVAFAKEELSAIANRISHALVHLVLRAVRFLERVLTRLVRHLRSTAVESEAPRETAREFVRTLSDFKDTLEAEQPQEAVAVLEKRVQVPDRRKDERREKSGSQ